LGVLFFFNLYKNYLSKLDGHKCPYYPTCSQFGVESVRRYGVLWGVIMLINRQMREYPNLKIDPIYPKVVKYGKLRVYDPPYRAYIWSKWWEGK
jgi:putative membrane protein insertion efficiency factor